MHNVLDLSGKVALVTGASSGIGAATAAVLAALGARVSLGYYGNASGAEEICRQITSAGGAAVAIKADLRRTAEVTALVAKTREALGPIDVLVNNAGSLVRRARIEEMSEEIWDEVFALNLKSAAFCTQAVAASMVDRKTGVVVNVGSIAGRNGGGAGAGAYAAAKAALMSLTRSWARELAPKGVRVNAVAPGVIATPFHETFSTPEMMQNFVNAIPLGRVGTSEECATVIAFLASDAARYVVGETIEINGGMLML